ncbi:MAG: glycosyltransferase family 2 protein [Lachnospiraceae bacterium]
MNANRVTAVVVTYNRKALLIECLDAILSQTVVPEKIIVINNASTDGTEKLFEAGAMYNRDTITCVNMSSNEGGSGGFYEGMRLVLEGKSDWVWIMDDDTIPALDCLEKLLRADSIVCANKKKASFYASTIFGTKGEFMNVPNINVEPSENGYPYFYEFLSESLLNINDATFVSLLIRTDAIKKCGLPCKDYFLWGDDGEYTLRLTHNYGPAYMVGNSVAIHKRVGAKKLSINNFNDPERIKMYHYYVRNNIINQLYYKKDRYVFITILKKMFQGISSIKLIFEKYGLMKFNAVWKGTFEGLVQYKKFKNYIDGQLDK